jgi:sulfur-carrier protein
MIHIQLLLFAVLKDIVGTDQRALTLPDGSRPADVWQQLRAEHPQLQKYAQPPMTAINETYAKAEAVLRDGDRLAFIPPVSGG